MSTTADRECDYVTKWDPQSAWYGKGAPLMMTPTCELPSDTAFTLSDASSHRHHRHYSVSDSMDSSVWLCVNPSKAFPLGCILGREPDWPYGPCRKRFGMRRCLCSPSDHCSLRQMRVTWLRCSILQQRRCIRNNPILEQATTTRYCIGSVLEVLRHQHQYRRRWGLSRVQTHSINHARRNMSKSNPQRRIS